MNWEAIGAISEGFGSLAVFVTLGYLAMQVRHQAMETRRALGQGRLDALRDLFAFASEERIARLTVRADVVLGAEPTALDAVLVNRAGMTREDAQVYIGFQAAFWNYQLHVLANIDELSASERAAFENGIRLRYRPSSVGRLFYDAMKANAHPDTIRYLENVLGRRA
jgi:hypothetical protein